ncbi:unnamed protein product [Mortierella alpina]
MHSCEDATLAPRPSRPPLEMPTFPSSLEPFLPSSCFFSVGLLPRAARRLHRPAEDEAMERKAATKERNVFFSLLSLLLLMPPVFFFSSFVCYCFFLCFIVASSTSTEQTILHWPCSFQDPYLYRSHADCSALRSSPTPLFFIREDGGWTYSPSHVSLFCFFAPHTTSPSPLFSPTLSHPPASLSHRHTESAVFISIPSPNHYRLAHRIQTTASDSDSPNLCCHYRLSLVPFFFFPLISLSFCLLSSSALNTRITRIQNQLPQ